MLRLSWIGIVHELDIGFVGLRSILIGIFFTTVFTTSLESNPRLSSSRFDSEQVVLRCETVYLSASSDTVENTKMLFSLSAWGIGGRWERQRASQLFVVVLPLKISSEDSWESVKSSYWEVSFCCLIGKGIVNSSDKFSTACLCFIPLLFPLRFKQSLAFIIYIFLLSRLLPIPQRTNASKMQQLNNLP